MWIFGYSTYAVLSDGRVACAYRKDGVHHLALLDPASGELPTAPVPAPIWPVALGGAVALVLTALAVFDPVTPRPHRDPLSGTSQHYIEEVQQPITAASRRRRSSGPSGGR